MTPTPATRRRNGKHVQESMPHGYREMLSGHTVRVNVALSGAFVLVLALVGPAGSFDALGLPERLAFGLLYACVCWPIFYSQIVVTLYFFRFRRPLQIGIALTIATMCSALPASAVVIAVESLAHPSYSKKLDILQLYFLVTAQAWAWTMLSWYLLRQRVRHTAAAEPTGAVRTVPATPGEANGATPSEGGDSTGYEPSGSSDPSPDTSPAGGVQDDSTDPPARNGGEPEAEQALVVPQRSITPRPAGRPGAPLLRLLPERLGTDLIYIKSEDHYLEVHTTVGSSLIKMRFSDAVAELSDHGMQVHRSYWVATRHVTRSVRSGKRTMLRLTGDHKVPVSVTHLPAVRAALRR
ncbi:MAG: LytTR family DNA-binding domain-containing protein [Gammaproteobacteria bacterium]|nr:LytTR family DNA-binding domain-containing protein [Gammaproteobacteria bacterium]